MLNLVSSLWNEVFGMIMVIHSVWLSSVVLDLRSKLSTQLKGLPSGLTDTDYGLG